VTQGAGDEAQPPVLEFAAPGSPAAGARLSDPGPIRNTLIQLASQFAGAVFSAGLVFFLVRALVPYQYGHYVLAVSIAGLLVVPTALGLPLGVGRFLADQGGEIAQVRAVLMVGLKLQVPIGLLTSLGLFALSAVLARAFGEPGLTWPLRWAAVSIFGQALYGFLSFAAMSIRQVKLAFAVSLIQSITEAGAAIALVLAGAGAAGATLGKAIGYTVAAGVGLVLTSALLGGRRSKAPAATRVRARTILKYSGATFIIDMGVGAIGQIDVLMIGALLSSTAVGNFGAVTRVLVVLGYLGSAVAAGVAPRVALGSGPPDTRAFYQALRYLIIIQGLALAPMVVWARPIIALALGARYRSASDIMRVLALMGFISAPAPLLSLSVTYLGQAARRVKIVFATLAFGAIASYVLIRLVGVIGAAIADDLWVTAYGAANLWICTRLITLDLRALARSLLRTILAAGAMAFPLLLIGTHHLSAVQWVIGLTAGVICFVAVLLVSREISLDELREAALTLRNGIAGPQRASG